MGIHSPLPNTCYTYKHPKQKLFLNLTSSSPRTITLTWWRGLSVPMNPESYVVWSLVLLQGHPWQTGLGGGTRLRMVQELLELCPTVLKYAQSKVCQLKPFANSYEDDYE